MRKITILSLVFIIAISVLIIGGCTKKIVTDNEPVNIPKNTEQQEVATNNKTAEQSSEKCSQLFIESLEAIELDNVGEGKHWKKGDYEPFDFLQCDTDKERARLSYIRELSPTQDSYYLVYFTDIAGTWYFDMSDNIFISKTREDGSATTLEDVLKTRNQMYWLTSDDIE